MNLKDYIRTEYNKGTSLDDIAEMLAKSLNEVKAEEEAKDQDKINDANAVVDAFMYFLVEHYSDNEYVAKLLDNRPTGEDLIEALEESFETITALNKFASTADEILGDWIKKL